MDNRRVGHLCHLPGRAVEERFDRDRSGGTCHSGDETIRPQEGYLLAGTELIPCSADMQQVECVSIYSPKPLEDNRKKNHYFSAYDNSK